MDKVFLPVIKILKTARKILRFLLGFFAFICPFLFLVNLIDLSVFIPKRYRIYSDKVKGNLKIAFLADLHGKEYGFENKKLLKAIAKEKPDIILCGGDMMNATPDDDNKVAKAFMKSVGKEYKVLYGMGNHEYRAGLYPEKYKDMYKDYMGVLKEAGVTVLINEKVSLEEHNVDVYGLQIDKHFYKRFKVQHMDDSYVYSVLGRPDEQKYNILLAHNPDFFPNYEKWAADLTLSGHCHGGLIRLPFIGGIAAPAVRFFPKYNGGLYRKNKRNLIVSCGLGTHTLPLRLFDPAELVIINLENSNS